MADEQNPQAAATPETPADSTAPATGGTGGGSDCGSHDRGLAQQPQRRRWRGLRRGLSGSGQQRRRLRWRNRGGGGGRGGQGGGGRGGRQGGGQWRPRRRSTPRAPARRLGHRIVRRPHLPLLPRSSRAAEPSASARSSSPATAKATSASATARPRKCPTPSKKPPRTPRRACSSVNLKGATIPHLVKGHQRRQHRGAGPGPSGYRRDGRQERPSLPGTDRHHRHPLTKAYGSTSPKNLVKATMAALRQLQNKEQVAADPRRRTSPRAPASL